MLGLKTSFEMSEGRQNVSLFFGIQIISYNKGVVLVNLVPIEQNFLLQSLNDFGAIDDIVQPVDVIFCIRMKQNFGKLLTMPY